jgi:hypothetical protein
LLTGDYFDDLDSNHFQFKKRFLDRGHFKAAGLLGWATAAVQLISILQVFFRWEKVSVWQNKSMKA